MAMEFQPLPDIALLESHLRYSAGDGVFTWAVAPRWCRQRAGQRAGRLLRGYLVIRFQGTNYCAHRLAWLLHYKEDPGNQAIDHVNLDRSDNRISNLRLATQSQNQANHPLRRDSTSGHKNVCWDSQRGKWVVKLKKQGQKIHVGFFRSLDEAAAAARLARERVHKDFARHA